MKKLIRHFRIVSIDVRVYRMSQQPTESPGELPFPVDEVKGNGNVCYSVTDNGAFVHRSFVYDKVRLLSLLGKKGPAIGNCVTAEAYRGQSVYPKMIHRIATGIVKNGKEVFIIVNSDNVASIRGIEKAGFELFATIRAKRFLLFYFGREIKRFG